MSSEVLTICERQLEDNPMRVDENLHENGAKVATNSPDANIRSTPACYAIAALAHWWFLHQQILSAASNRSLISFALSPLECLHQNCRYEYDVAGCRLRPQRTADRRCSDDDNRAISPYAGGGGRQTRWHCEYWRPGQTSSRRAGTGCQ